MPLLKIHYPEWVIKDDPPPVYNVALATEPLGNTGEIPENFSAMVGVLAE